MTFAPLGDSAVVVTLGTKIDEATLVRVRSLTLSLELENAAWLIDVVPAYAAVTVFYDPFAPGLRDGRPFERVCEWIANHTGKIEHAWPDVVQAKLAANEITSDEVCEIPVCYGGELGPDLDDVARHCGLTSEAVIDLHLRGDYLVHAVGFAPGFPYLGGLNEKLRTPRRPTPRLSVPKGSVGIGWTQTGIYPLETPGGWQLIGRTPLEMFRPNELTPSLLKVGDRVRFRRIGAQEFATWR
jgi:inhibitor of KinA